MHRCARLLECFEISILENIPIMNLISLADVEIIPTSEEQSPNILVKSPGSTEGERSSQHHRSEKTSIVT
ncbi:hypothetical protein X975_25470, partial [Stegodyphus mimosarum]